MSFRSYTAIAESLSNFASELAASPRILIATNDDVLRENVNQTLKKLNCDQHFFTSGAQALEQMEGCEWDVCIVDDNLSDTPAAEVVERVRSECPNIPVIIIGTSPDVIGRAASTGPLSVIQKPQIDGPQFTALCGMLNIKPIFSPMVAAMAGVGV